MKVVDQETGEDLEAKQKAEGDQPREAAAGGGRIKLRRNSLDETTKAAPHWPPFYRLLATIVDRRQI